MDKYQQLKDVIDLFYKDLTNVIENRIENARIRIEQNNEEEKNIEKEIKNIEKDIQNIKDIQKNHINNNVELNLLPKKYLEVDKLQKDIFYKKKELEALRKYHEEEKEELYNENNKNLKKCYEYDTEKMNIIECIIDKERFENMKYQKVQYQEYDRLKKMNDAIFDKYLPKKSEEENSISAAAPVTNSGNLTTSVKIYNKPH